HSGVPYFKKSFSFDEFCYNGENPDLKNYIDYLISGVGNKIPLLQFNRSALRVKWFKQNYPGSLNIYLVRNPRDQWQSYAELYKRTNYNGFFLMDLITASMNKDKNDFLVLPDHLPLFHYNNEQQDKENNFYQVVLDSYSQEEKYLIFYYTWFKALVENVLNADFILNINLLSKESSYQKKVIKFLKEQGVRDIDFKDARIPGYSLYSLAPETMATIEGEVQNLLIQSLTEDQINGFFQEMSREDKGYFQFKKEDFIRIGKEKNKGGADIREKTIEKFEKMILSFAEEWSRQIETNKKSENLVNQKDLVIVKKDEELQNKDLLLLEKDERLMQKDEIIVEKDQLIVRKDGELQNKDLLLLEKDEQLKQKDGIIAEKDQVIFKKDEELQNKDLLLLEKDKIIAEKDRLIFKEDGELQRKLLLLAKKSERLKQREEIIAEKDLRLAELKEQLKQKDRIINRNSLRLSETEEQLMQMEHELRKIRRSYTYRIGRVIVFPVKVVKRLMSKSLRVRGRKGFSHYMEKPVSISPGKYEKKINLSNQLNIKFGRHRSGWAYAVRKLSVLHNPKGALLDSFIERTFCWNPEGVKPHLQPWIGFIHVPPEMPRWFSDKQASEVIFNSEAWKKSLPYCNGLFTLSEYHQKYLETRWDIPVNALVHPTEFPANKWTWEKFTANNDKKIVQVGWWLRKLHAIYQLPLPKTQYKKVFLSVKHKNLPNLLKKEREILLNEGTFNDDMYETAETVTYLPNSDYDKLLGENIVFICLYDASANNTIIECIARNTPILINPLEAVKEYLGDDYPLYYNSLEEAAEKAANFDLIYKTHQYLVNHSIKPKLTGQYFLESFANSPIYSNLTT
ncbi:MAG: hypothetical protein JSV88_04415, partial [Candidatus Aminicenantes bacterium]